MKIQLFFLLITIVAFPINSLADVCQSAPSFNAKGEYIKCIVTIEDERQEFLSKEVDSLKCSQYCIDLSENIKSNHSERGGDSNNGQTEREWPWPEECDQIYFDCMENCGSNGPCMDGCDELVLGTEGCNRDSKLNVQSNPD